MRQKTFKTIILLIISSFATNSFAAWTQKTQIKELRAQANGMYVILESFTNSDENINCENTGFWMSDTAPNYTARTSMLISAFATKQNIKISYYGCNGIYHEIGTISFVR